MHSCLVSWRCARLKKGSFLSFSLSPKISGLRIKERKEVYEGEVTELTPVETENQVGTDVARVWCQMALLMV